jgi:hypothetical protein
MSRTISLLVRALPLGLLAGMLALPGPAPAGDPAPFRWGDFMAVNTRGAAKNISTDPMRTVFEFDLYSLATGERIGTAHDDVFCSTTAPPPCQVFDALTTFRLPDGEITNHAQVSVVPDPQRPGQFLVAARPESSSIVAGTGAYAGRSGRVRLTGLDDGSRYPSELSVDDIWVIELDPK